MGTERAPRLERDVTEDAENDGASKERVCYILESASGENECTSWGGESDFFEMTRGFGSLDLI